MEVLSIIPARGNSKGIIEKNIRILNGKPLIYYTIQAAKKSKHINRILVSTDNIKIANIAKKFGADVPFVRPKSISKDNSSSYDVIKHTLHFLEKNENYIPDIVIFLQPTSPLRTSKKIDKSIQLLKHSKSDSVLSVYKPHSHPYRAFWYKDGLLKPFKNNFQKYSRRQSHPSLYSPTGEIYAFWYETIKKYDSIYGKKIKPIFPDDDEYIVDIDAPVDLFIVEMLLKYWKNYKKRF
jgi:CMP-N,N'-diacetyllegionaminic acid synthase